MPYTVSEVLLFLNQPKSREEIGQKFGLSNSESWHLVQWLETGKFVETIPRIQRTRLTNRVTLYMETEAWKASEKRNHI